MTPEQKSTYKKLARQVDEAYTAYTKLRKSPNSYNNRLQRMQDFLRSLPADYSCNSYMRLEKITK